MKRLIGILLCAILFFGMQTLINCSSPLESDFNGPNPPSPPPPPQVDTLYIYDTTFVTDTVFEGDTVYLTDTVEVVDSIYLNDTLFVYDTVEVLDSIYFNDTTFVTDTFYVLDTIMVVDTVTIVDTTYIEIPGEDCPFTVCSYISAYHKKIYYRFPDLDGQYRLTFTKEDDSRHRGGDDDDDDGDDCDNKHCPLKKLKIHINNSIYFWEVGENDTFVVERNINPNTFVKIFPYTSKWCKHKLDICLTVTPL